MKEFEVIIEETVSQSFTVVASSLEEAEEIAQNKYYEGEFVLEPGDCQYRTMMARDNETKEETSWGQF